MTPILDLEPDETQWLVDTIGALSQWPPEGCEWALRDVPTDLRDDESCGPMFRLRLIQAHITGARSFALSVQELWLLEAVLAQFNTRVALTTYRGSGQPLLSLQHKVWCALLDVCRDVLPAVEERSVADDIDQWLKGGE